MNGRAPMIAGAAFAVLYATAVVVLHALPGADPGVTRVQALLLTFAALALVVVLAFARDRLSGPPAHLFTIGSTLLVAELCIAVWFLGGLSLRPGQTAVATARAIEDVGVMWLPVATIANIVVAAPILLYANEGRLPRWLGILAAVFAVEQLIETITVIGPPGSFISPGGPMNHYVGGLLSVLFVAGLGVALGIPTAGESTATPEDTDEASGEAGDGARDADDAREPVGE
ncbi:hypothetical protein [Mycobacterium sp. PSTR-4-N]|uniref:hypothetical protein n=1 Tax=Mycobacterium sp. PSTR-4-N TaxID=2917745 RepID=UPI001F14B1BD|nr:hypothetical protein [Mycobacterium sp. PSTR-4-N]MCG7596219.1 hypothetical protein [Mycobacterium sp. PSTR-4-N]